MNPSPPHIPRLHPWNRPLWAIEMRSGTERPESMILGTQWHKLEPRRYEGEPTRALLFTTRKAASDWARQARLKHAKHSPNWKFKPVRVRETLIPHDSPTCAPQTQPSEKPTNGSSPTSKPSTASNTPGPHSSASTSKPSEASSSSSSSSSSSKSPSP